MKEDDTVERLQSRIRKTAFRSLSSLTVSGPHIPVARTVAVSYHGFNKDLSASPRALRRMR